MKEGNSFVVEPILNSGFMYIKGLFFNSVDSFIDMNDTGYRGPMLGLGVRQHEKGHTDDATFLTPAQVDDLITILQYWRKEYTDVPHDL